MPSQTHETLIELFRQRPQLAPEILAGSLGIALPDWEQARLDSGELTDVAPTEYRADSVITLVHENRPVLVVVVEVQLRPDKTKRYSWPVYLTTLRARLRCPAVLLTLCPNAAAANWCGHPIELGHPGWVLRPLVAGPDQVPVILDVQRARDSPELAVLSAVTHGDHPQLESIFQALLGGLQTLDETRADLYADFVLASLPAAMRKHLEDLMDLKTYKYQSDYAKRHFSRGKAEGRAEAEAEVRADALLSFLAARGIAVPDSAHARIVACTDVAQLDRWIKLAADINSVDQLFL